MVCSERGNRAFSFTFHISSLLPSDSSFVFVLSVADEQCPVDTHVSHLHLDTTIPISLVPSSPVPTAYCRAREPFPIPELLNSSIKYRIRGFLRVVFHRSPSLGCLFCPGQNGCAWSIRDIDRDEIVMDGETIRSDSDDLTQKVLRFVRLRLIATPQGASFFDLTPSTTTPEFIVPHDVVHLGKNYR